MASAISKQRGESKSNNLNYDGNLNDSNLENRILEYDFNCNDSNIKNLVYNNALNLMSSIKKKPSATSWTAPAASRFIRTNIRPPISIVTYILNFGILASRIYSAHNFSNSSAASVLAGWPTTSFLLFGICSLSSSRCAILVKRPPSCPCTIIANKGILASCPTIKPGSFISSTQ